MEGDILLSRGIDEGCACFSFHSSSYFRALLASVCVYLFYSRRNLFLDLGLVGDDGRGSLMNVVQLSDLSMPPLAAPKRY
jgi:hypothetical protein